MLQKTHGVAGVLAAELVILQSGVPILSWEAAAGVLIGCFAGPLADIDKPGSVMAKLFFPLSALLRFLQIKHRTLTHSLVFLLALTVLAIPLPSFYFWTFLFAYATHPLIDLLNEQGVRLLWPAPFKIRLLPKWLAIETGSAAEVIFRWGLIFVGVLLLGQEVIQWYGNR
ncbi:metal-dependent hydrolase [Paenibacillus sp. GD4]|uniref:metal-dependent hydrolase n=1 Tax=Paenibacillus sp. GD4 TaxID=3068890 RepID=UPI002796B22A|nr:metal-dependent hydrolase [Paenibacillus sp. GD4]MDQ1913354.1 metal-dependent hydrolase [Paenibacillus sp. GD4]